MFGDRLAEAAEQQAAVVGEPLQAAVAFVLSWQSTTSASTSPAISSASLAREQLDELAELDRSA